MFLNFQPFKPYVLIYFVLYNKKRVFQIYFSVKIYNIYEVSIGVPLISFSFKMNVKN